HFLLVFKNQIVWDSLIGIRINNYNVAFKSMLKNETI
ncbi:unnamed protein product, partial [marine sediment metagenome]